MFTEQSSHTRFINFLRNVLNWCNKAPIHKFILKCSKFEVFCVNQVNQWIDLCITIKEQIKMSCALFAYHELVALKIGKRFVLDVPVLGSLVFPSLRKLHLHDIEFDDETIHKVLSGCPVLEDLAIMCRTEKWVNLVIKAPTLKVFTLVAPSEKQIAMMTLKNCTRSSSLLNLQIWKFSSIPEPTKGICFGNLDSLVEAEINIFQHTFRSNSGNEVVSGIVNAKIICLTDHTTELIFWRTSCDLPIFHNLTELRLGLKIFYHGKLLSQLLHNSPNLQVLVLKRELNNDIYLEHKKWEKPDSVPECFSRHLEVVKIVGFHKQTCVGEFIKYVLQSAKVLKQCSASPDWTDLREVELVEVKINKYVMNYLTE